MEEVDRIVIHSLKTIGCDIDDEHVSLATFTAELIYEAVWCCVAAIKGELSEVPRKLPQGMAQRFRAGTSLANLVKDVGFSGEVGYQSFLYSNELEIRKMLMFLVDKLPRAASDSAGSTNTAGGSVELFRRSVANSIRQQLKKVWLPHVCRRNELSSQRFRGQMILAPCRKNTTGGEEYNSKYLPELAAQTPNRLSLCSALIENNALRLIADQNSEWRLHAPNQVDRHAKQSKSKIERVEEIKTKLQSEKEAEREANIKNLLESQLTSQTESALTQLDKLQIHAQAELLQTAAAPSTDTEQATPAAESEEEIQARQEQEIESFKSELEEITKRITKLNKSIDKATTATQQSQSELEEKKKHSEEQKKVYQVKKKTLDVLPEAEQTISKVKQMIDGADERMKALERQWVKHQAPLTEQMVSLRAEASSRQEKIDQKLAEIQDFKKQMKTASEDAKAKDELVTSLRSEFESMSRDVSRSSYTKKITEIVANIKKQKRDIDKVLTDTRSVQKDINMLTGKLDRTFTVTDELIFKDAKRDESVRAAYKYLASLHDNCSAVRDTIEETGVILREIRQLEDQIDQESSKDAADNLEKITADYKQIKRENQQLIAKLKQSTA